MQRMLKRNRSAFVCIAGRMSLLAVVCFAASGAVAADSPKTAGATRANDLWRQTLDRASSGDFNGASESINKLHISGPVTEQVKQWLDEYQTRQTARKEMDREDFDKYVGYAKARIERKEYDRAMGWVLWALDSASDRTALLESDWVSQLTKDGLAKAQEHRDAGEWRDAWRLYSQLASLFEREPRYEKLEREAVTHIRLESMFKKENHWEERVDKVRWRDAEHALQFIDQYYVEPADFKAIAERGLEQLLLLAESKTAQETFESLANEDDRHDFEARIKKRLERIRSAPELDRAACLQHFRRTVKNINAQTVALPEKLIVAELMRGALTPLDDFTNIIWPAASDEFDKHTRGDFVGVGISIIKNGKEEIEVVTPLDGGSAYKAGIQAGDVISHVNGSPLKGFSINKVVKTITGPANTPVTLTIQRGDDALEFPLTRQRVVIQSVKGVKRNESDPERWDHWLDRESGIGYVRVTNFARNTVEDLTNVLSELSAGGLEGLVLDLRDNPGGLLDSAWQMSSLFLGEGEQVVSTKGRIRSEDQSFGTPGEGAFSKVPLIVLVNDRSASASEIVSGAIRDNHRGLVVGERTFGKFSVQNLIPLSRSGSKLKITTARYYLPSGASLHRTPQAETWGVEPDISIRLVRKEKSRLWLMQREANLLGPAKATPKEKTDEEKAADAKDKDADSSDKDKDAKVEGDDKDKDKEKLADADEDEKDKLPKLEQLDKNERPKQDAQLDTALLLMRVNVAKKSAPTFAQATAPAEKKTGHP